MTHRDGEVEWGTYMTVEALRGLEDRDLTHRGIRPDNIFYADEKDKKRVVPLNELPP